MRVIFLSLLMFVFVNSPMAQQDHGLSFGGGIGIFHVTDYFEHFTSSGGEHVYVNPGPSFRAGYYLLFGSPAKRLKLETGLQMKVMNSKYYFHDYIINCNTGQWIEETFSGGGDWMLYFQLPAELRWQQHDNWYLKSGPVVGYARPLGPVTSNPPGYFARLWDVGATAAIGGKLSQRWGVEMALYQGFVNTNKFEGIYDYYKLNMFNRSASIYLYYSLKKTGPQKEQ